MHLLQNGILIGILAHGMIGVSLVWDKVLLRRPETRNLLSYVFWLGAMSIFGLILMAFGFKTPPLSVAMLAFWTGVIHLAANYFYYSALNAGEASQTLAIMGGFSPLATALIAIPLLEKPLGGASETAFALLVCGGFAMFLSERFAAKKVLPMILLASGMFGLVNVLEKVVFNRVNFVTGYTIFTFGTFAGSMFLLLRASWRKQIFESSEHAPPRSRFWYFVNRFISGLGSFLIFYAVSRANPAVVDAISGVRYAIIFVLAWVLSCFKPAWLQENFARWTLVGKSAATALIVAGLVLLALGGGETAQS